MKSYLKATALVAFLSRCCASLAVARGATDSSCSNIDSVAGSTGHDHVSVNFSIPCPGCSFDGKDDLELDLLIQATDSECRNHRVSVNGVPLVSNDDQGAFRRPLTFPHSASPVSVVPNVNAIFDVICIPDQVSLLSIEIVRSTGEADTDSAPGFTVSFTQTGQPQILRLQPVPQLPLKERNFNPACVFDLPNKRLDIITQQEPSQEDVVQNLQNELKKLDVLRSHLKDLEKEIRKQEATIMSIWKAEFSQCSTIKCYFKTALKKVPILAHLIVEHIRHHSHLDVDFFRNSTHINCSDNHDQLLTQPDVNSFENHDEVEDLQDVPILDIVQPTPSPSTSTIEVETAKPTRDTSAPPEHSEQPSHAHHGPPFLGRETTMGQTRQQPSLGTPPWVKPGSRPPWAKPGSNPSSWGPPPWVNPGGDSAETQEQSSPSMHSQSHHVTQTLPSLTSQQIMRIRLVGAVIGLLVVLLFGACMFTCIKHKRRIFNNPRCRAEIMSMREEYLTKRAYRKAACKHKWRTFLKRVRSVLRVEDGEKDGILEPQDDSIIDRGVNGLRVAHHFVGNMMRAEEGESGYFTRTRPRSESLPSYTSGPPGYSSGQEGDISVIDGFTGYTPSVTDETPESSVVDCSPRMSFETQRTS